MNSSTSRSRSWLGHKIRPALQEGLMPTSLENGFRYRTQSLAFFVYGNKTLQSLSTEIQCLPIQANQVGQRSPPNKWRHVHYVLYSFPKELAKSLIAKASKNNFLLVFRLFLRKYSMWIKNSPLHLPFRDLLGDLWVVKYSTFPSDEGSILKNRGLKTCNTVPIENKKRVLNHCAFRKL